MFTDEKEIKREKAKAREIRNSQWWKRRLSKGICYYCSKSFSPDELTMDHVVPLSRGGKSTKGNLVCSCKECNNKKKNLLPMEWSEYLSNQRS
ncbi:MAG: HNH endonuclease [Desulforegulaceae bacterium]|nr:HNH endonuclease [Desulforegulaceae bacterium]